MHACMRACACACVRACACVCVRACVCVCVCACVCVHDIMAHLVSFLHAQSTAVIFLYLPFTYYIFYQVANHVASRCVEMLGGVGFIKDFPAEKFYRDSKIGKCV